MRERLSLLVTVVSVATSIVATLAMRDHVRLVEIVGLFASGVGTGAGIVAVVADRRRRADLATAQGRTTHPLT